MPALSSRTMIIISLMILLALVAILYGCTTTHKATSTQTASPQQMNQKNLSTNSATNGNDQSNEANSNNLTNPTIASSQNDEPNSTNQTTTASNTNNNNQERSPPKYVRADVRHLLQQRYSNREELQSALAGAALLQSYLDNPKQDAVALTQRYDCMTINLTQADQNLIKALTFNTPERAQQLKAGLQSYQPPVSVEIAIDTQGNPVSPCQSK